MAHADALEPSRREFRPVNIASGASLSGEVDLTNFTLTGIIFPGTFTGTAISFRAATKLGTDFYDVYDSAGTEVSLTVASNRYVVVTQATAEPLKGLGFIRVRSGLTGAPTAEGANRTIILVLAVKF